MLGLALRAPAVRIPRRNAARNTINAGGVGGSPGTTPTGHNNDATFINQLAFGVEDGLDYVDLQIHGDLTGFAIKVREWIPYENAIPGHNEGSIWTLSYYIKLVGGATTNSTAQAATVYQTTAAGGYIANPYMFPAWSAIPTSGPLRQYRAQGQFILPATCARGGIAIGAQGGSSGTVDLTIRVGGVQFERGARATPYIRNPNTVWPVLR